MHKSIAKAIFNMIPAESALLYRAAQRYVDRFNSDNNSVSTTNGEERLLRQVLPKLREGVVFDVGANVGEWSRTCIAVESSLSMHLFEPSKTTFGVLTETAWPTNIKLNNFGFGETNAFLELNIVEAASGLNSIYKRYGVKCAMAQSLELVEIRTLDDYCKENGVEHIDFLKVDVEGHELAVFNGMNRMLSQSRVDMIQFEYGGCALDARVHLADIWRYLESHGFAFFKIYPDRLVEMPTYNQGMETFKYSNWLAANAKGRKAVSLH